MNKIIAQVFFIFLMVSTHCYSQSNPVIVFFRRALYYTATYRITMTPCINIYWIFICRLMQKVNYHW